MRKKIKKTISRRKVLLVRPLPKTVKTADVPVIKPYASLTLLVEFDSAGLATLEIPVTMFNWSVVRRDTPVALGQLDNRMPHRLISLQINLPDGNTKILR